MKNIMDRIDGDTIFLSIQNTSDREDVVYLFGNPLGKNNSDNIKIRAFNRQTEISYPEILQAINKGEYGYVSDFDITIDNEQNNWHNYPDDMYIDFHSEGDVHKIHFINILDPFKQPITIYAIPSEDEDVKYKLNKDSYFEFKTPPKSAWKMIYFNNNKI